MNINRKKKYFLRKKFSELVVVGQDETFFMNKKYLILITLFICILLFVAPSFAATTQLHIVKYANDGTTILSEKTLTFQEMEYFTAGSGRRGQPIIIIRGRFLLMILIR